MSLYCFDFARIAVTIAIAPRGTPGTGWPNPTDRLFHTERSPSGTRHVWIERRVDIMIERRSVSAGTPWVSLLRIG
jgi:hypothetical protein